jgi:hypothetical protein
MLLISKMDLPNGNSLRKMFSPINKPLLKFLKSVVEKTFKNQMEIALLLSMSSNTKNSMISNLLLILKSEARDSSGLLSG